MKKLIIAGLTIVAFGLVALYTDLPATASADDKVVMIVNKKVGLANTRKEPLKKLFLGQTQALGGKTVVPVKPATAAVYGVFRSVVLGMTEQAEKEYWLRETFKGTVRSVRQVPDAKAVADFVANTDNGVGITTMSEYERVKDKVAILMVDGKASLN